MELWSRRKFFLTSLAGSALAGANNLFGRTTSNGNAGLLLPNLTPPAAGKRPLSECMQLCKRAEVNILSRGCPCGGSEMK
jgi:hypothetical protein